jgi:hypothetical protein
MCAGVLNAPLDECDGLTILGVAAKQGNFPKSFATLFVACDPNTRDAFDKLPEDYLFGRPGEYIN